MPAKGLLFMDAAARLRGPLQSPSALFANHAAAGPKPGTHLSIIRGDRPKEDLAKAPSVKALISPTAKALLARDSRPLARKAGKDEPAADRVNPAANETSRPQSASHIPDRIGPRDVATGIQAFGGLNVRSSTGGPKLTSGN
jgi:hypothetical protein